MQKKYLILIVVILFGAFSVFSFVKAQVKNESIVLVLSPANPRAGENVTARISSIATDLNKAKIAWIVNGQTAIERVGQKSFSFNAGVAGSKTNLGVSIETTDGTILNKSTIVAPADIDMLVEAYNTYAPPFYKGRILPSVEGMVKVVAMPNSNTVGGLSYDWNQDGENMSDSSGYNKNYYVYKNIYLEKNNTVSVEVTDLSGSSMGDGDTTINYINPKVMFYKKDPIFGTLWDSAVTDGHTVDTNGEIIVAEPYYIWPKNLSSSSLSFKWSIDGSELDAQTPINEIGIKPTSGQSGQSKISVAINNINSLFLSITKDLNVNF